MKWEYKSVKYEAGNMFSTMTKRDDLDVQLNKLGVDGWELATALYPTTGGTTTILVFKRPTS